MRPSEEELTRSTNAFIKKVQAQKDLAADEANPLTREGQNKIARDRQYETNKPAAKEAFKRAFPNVNAPDDLKEKEGANGKEGNNVNADRQRAVRQAWKQESENVKSGKGGTRNWSKAEKDQLINTGKVQGYQGHHINSVKTNPNQAGNPNNIKFVTPQEHLDEHGGNFQNPTQGPPVEREPDKPPQNN